MSSIDYDMIDRYLEGSMSPEEKSAFEESMRTDESLKKEVELYKEVSDSLQGQLHPGDEEKALHNTLKELRGEYFAKGKQKEKNQGKLVTLSPIKRWLAVAASVVVLLTAATFFWSPWKKDLFQQYAQTEMPAVNERGEPADSLLKLATEKFNASQFSESVPLFESILKIDSANAYVHYYYGIALLHSDQTEKARKELDQLYNGESTFKYDAAFYIALSYLREKDKNTTKEWLNKVPQDAAIYQRAQKLLDKL